jgi:hypothetical protein
VYSTFVPIDMMRPDGSSSVLSGEPFSADSVGVWFLGTNV